MKGGLAGTDVAPRDPCQPLRSRGFAVFTLLERAPVAKRNRRNFSIRRGAGPTPLTTDDREVLEKILAALVARAFASDHPKSFSSGRWTGLDPSVTGRTENNVDL